MANISSQTPPLDQRATATPAASSIPVAGVDGKIDAGWIPASVLGATPSVVIAQAALPASVNLSTEGTIDWLEIHTLTGLRPFLTSLHAKVRGEDDMLRTFMWVKAPGGGSTLTNGDLDFPRSITGSDDVDGAGLTNFENATYISVTGTQTGHGFRFRARATRSQRVLRVYMGRNACTVLCTAALTDGTTSTSSIAQPSGSGAPFTWLGRMLTITFNSSNDGQELLVECKATTTHATAGTVNFMCATLASS